MDTYSYWRRQTPGAPLFPDVQWNKPERRQHAGRLGIVGGNKLGFAGVAESYQTALEAGAGVVRVLLPDALKATVPSAMTDVVFGPSTSSGGLAKDGTATMTALGEWADGVLMIGDGGKNSETAIVYENFIREYKGQLTITRDSVDLLRNSSSAMIERSNTLIVASFAQLQKLFQTVYYPKILTFSMQLAQLVESLHKFTITYPVSIIVLHDNHLVLASNGDIVTQEWNEPMSIWHGTIATRAACYWLWSPKKPLEAMAASIVL